MLKKTLLASAVLATMAGFALANYQQGTIAYQEGRYTSAFIEFKESAESGHAAAQYMLGRLYQEGRGVDRDLVQAYAWYDASALAGYSPAGAARDALAPQLTASQLQTATTLAAQFRTPAAPDTGGTTVSTTAYVPPYSVRNVQSALSQLGYSPGPIDGLMGSKTRAAIRAYQIDSGLPASGEPSVALHEHLQRTLAKQAGTPQPAPSTGPSTTLISEVQGELRLRGYDIPSISGVLDTATVSAIKRYQSDASLTVDGRVTDELLAQLRSGRTDPGVDYRAQVKSVQQALNSRGYDAGPADGALGPRTRGAIRAFQIANGMTATGAIDKALLASLGVAGGTASGGTTGTTLIAAIEGELIKHNYAAGTIDGVLDAQAAAAISAFQKDAGLTVTGKASQNLLNALRNSSVVNNSSKVNQLVWEVENELDDLGYRTGVIDGTMDDETREGIEDFQANAGMDVTGKVNNKLLVALRNADDDGDDDDELVQLTPRQIWELEVRLDARGYDVGRVDRVADQNTVEGVKDYQKDEGLKATGKMDEKLLQRLQQADAGDQRSWNDLSASERGMLIMQGLLNSLGQPNN
ncbi:MAG TPA: peptidoglycan-binding protein [Kiloniellales bacterium]|nr:peptidoglycan-binding protein [Kiloniellales bacterium]